MSQPGMTSVPAEGKKMANTLKRLLDIFTALDGHSFDEYQTVKAKTFCHEKYQICFVHVQGSPGALPASVCRIRLNLAELGLGEDCLSSKARSMATADFLVRTFDKGVRVHARQNRGAQGSGSFQPAGLPPQVLERNLVRFTRTHVRITFHISLPGSAQNRILGRQAARMFDREISGIIDHIKDCVGRDGQLKKQCDVVEDMLDLQNRLDQLGLIGFVGDGAILPRRSGISQEPLKGAVPFYAPQKMAVEITLPNAGKIRGMGIRPGVTLVIGGGFHGKSALVEAVAKGIYPHIPGDGREQVVTHSEAIYIGAEPGRAVTGLDISGFMDTLPGDVDTTKFSTQNASGSTSEAAAVIEAVLGGARLLLMDEDSSAANFLIKDQNMRKLIPEDAITPFFDRVRELSEKFGVSTLMAAGGNSGYLGMADHVIAMQTYLPADMTDPVRKCVLPHPPEPNKPLIIGDRRQLLEDNFDPSYWANRLKKKIGVRIKPLRGQENILEYGNQHLDLTTFSALVDPHQVTALGYALLFSKTKLKNAFISPSGLARAVCRRMEKEGLEILLPPGHAPIFFAGVRCLELAGVINRFRNLKIRPFQARDGAGHDSLA
ncbi:MAG: ABC-ATPase domain-containing protein [Proteobacteria bacterium]|nr:ABC-ATPase domain-containing protein [Pseudomonadota bacterium]